MANAVDPLGQGDGREVDARRDNGLQGLGRGEEQLRPRRRGQAEGAREGVGGAVRGGEEGGMQRGAELVAPFLLESDGDPSLLSMQRRTWWW
jgi:hypothetical protein